jgi:hypothetical protein
VPYGREGEGLHLPPIPEALSRACPGIKYPAAAPFANCTNEAKEDAHKIPMALTSDQLDNHLRNSEFRGQRAGCIWLYERRT